MTGSLIPKALYPLSAVTRGRDISRNRNKPGKLIGVRPAKGPDGKRGTSYRFFGRPLSFIKIPNSGPIDTKYSITILAWIYLGGKGGPIFQYGPRNRGVTFSIKGSKTLFASYSSRRSLSRTRSLRYRLPKLFKWFFVGTSYDYITGIARLFVNYRVVKQRRVGRRIRLATNYPAVIGVRRGNYFKGKIACIQVLNMALSSRQMIKRRRTCFSQTGNMCQ